MSEIIKLHDLRPAPGEKTPKTRVVPLADLEK